MPSSLSSKPVIAVTMGDAAGIGPEVIIKALASPRLKRKQNFVVIGQKTLLAATAKKLKLKPLGNVIEPSLHSPIQYIDTALELIKKGEALALVTAPVSKQNIEKTGIKFTGHTEYLAEKAGVKSPAMMFVAPKMKVVLATTHLSIKNVGSHLSREKIIGVVLLADKFLKKSFGIKNPRIGVSGLNPHAGEGGLLGQEEKDIIGPAIKTLKDSWIPQLEGPLPADSAFYELHNNKYDLLVCMYHDQAMIPIKMLARNSAVNVTLGLPYARTSPVHGVAFDIAGSGKADPSSMIAAMNLALRLAK